MLAMEQGFGVENVDAEWADGAEADILGWFAQRAGLKLHRPASRMRVHDVPPANGATRSAGRFPPAS